MNIHISDRSRLKYRTHERCYSYVAVFAPMLRERYIAWYAVGFAIAVCAIIVLPHAL